MKILSLLFFIFLLSNLSKESELSDALIDSIYDYLPDILTGVSTIQLSSSVASKCSNDFRNKKSQILPLLKDVISDLIDGASITDIIRDYTLRAGAIWFLNDNCRLFALGILIANIDSENGIKKIGQAMEEHNENLYNLERDIKKEESLEKRLYYIGKIIYNILNFYVK